MAEHDYFGNSTGRRLLEKLKTALGGKANQSEVARLSEEIADKVSKTGITLGLHSDGKYYIFVDGAPVGTGFELSGNNGDVFGYVDQNNNIVLNGNLADGSYSIKYEMEDGSTVDIGDLVLDSNVYYSVTNNLTNCTNSNSDTQAIGGQAYTATITANSGYELKSVTVTMGGNPVTVSGGNINIASVTGNIIITAVAEVSKPPYTNLADPTSNDWKIGRLGSDGSIRTDVTKAIVTNFISATAGDIIRVSGCNIQNYHMAGYDAGKNKVFAEKPILTNKTYYDATTLSSTYAQIEIKADIALVRFTCTNPAGTTAMVVSEDIIITKNEPIV